MNRKYSPLGVGRRSTLRREIVLGDSSGDFNGCHLNIALRLLYPVVAGGVIGAKLPA